MMTVYWNASITVWGRVVALLQKAQTITQTMITMMRATLTKYFLFVNGKQRDRDRKTRINGSKLESMVLAPVLWEYAAPQILVA
jgi:hypothetical protein